ncbi:MAG: hypothetical protein IKX54_01835 [Lachnospiraceae bacterium]|nr:hypothetical protein [Lachnospiraceae bacterium]
MKKKGRIRKAVLGALMLVCLVLAACGSDTESRKGDDSPDTTVTPDASVSPAATMTPTPDPNMYLASQTATRTADGVTVQEVTEYNADGLLVSRTTRQKAQDGGEDSWEMTQKTLRSLENGAETLVTAYYQKGVVTLEEHVWEAADGLTERRYVYYDANGRKLRENTEVTDAEGTVVETRSEEWSEDGVLERSSAERFLREGAAEVCRYYSAENGCRRTVVGRSGQWVAAYRGAAGTQTRFVVVDVTEVYPADSGSETKQYRQVMTSWEHEEHVLTIVETEENRKVTDDGYTVRYRVTDAKEGEPEEIVLIYENSTLQTLVGADYGLRTWRKPKSGREETTPKGPGSLQVKLRNPVSGEWYVALERSADGEGRPVSEVTYDEKGALLSKKTWEYTPNGLTVTEHISVSLIAGEEREQIVESTYNSTSGDRVLLRERTAVKTGDGIKEISVTENEYDGYGNIVKSVYRRADGQTVQTDYENTYLPRKKS